MKSNVHFVWQQLISAQHKATMRGNVSIGPVPFLPDQRLCPKTLCYLLFLITNLQIPLMNSTMKGQHTEVKWVWFGAKSYFSCRDLIRIFVFVKASLARITQQSWHSTRKIWSTVMTSKTTADKVEQLKLKNFGNCVMKSFVMK